MAGGPFKDHLPEVFGLSTAMDVDFSRAVDANGCFLPLAQT